MAGFALVLPPLGCKDREPPPPVYRDLATTDSELLLPTSGAWKSQSIQSGQAEWVPFREPNAEAPPEETPADSDAQADQGEGENAAIEGEIRDLIAEYNNVSKERNLDELLEYHVEEQRPAMRAVLELSYGFLDKLHQLADILREKLPDEVSRINSVFADLDQMADESLKVTALDVKGPEEVVGNLPPGGLTSEVRFVLVDGDWYVDYPGMPTEDQIRGMMQLAMGPFDTALQGLSSGQVPADQVLNMLEQQMQMMKQMQGSAADEAPADQDDSGG
ncbi:MAG: hypothetical protein J5J06_05300 [Phycisphaerae bacterium]|nr:hypothetical protein [Phycisphaerae bacterium]